MEHQRIRSLPCPFQSKADVVGTHQNAGMTTRKHEGTRPKAWSFIVPTPRTASSEIDIADTIGPGTGHSVRIQ